MRTLCLVVTGLVLYCFQGWGQSADTSSYKNLKVKVEDVNIVSGYYQQTGNHASVTGGIGSQELNDISNSIDLKLSNYDVFDRKYTYDIGVGLDHHTAASSAYVSLTGASNTGGTRFYPSFNWQVENAQKGNTFGLGASFSAEYTYHSYGMNILFAKTSKDQSREFSAKGNVFLDRVKLVTPSEFRDTQTTTVVVHHSSASRGGDTYTTVNSGASSEYIPSSSRNTFDAAFSLTQVVNKRMQVALLTDAVYQTGYLGLPYYRVYFTDGSVQIENLPTSRLKIPIGMRVNYFAGDKLILKGYYRFYTDDWGVRSHTVSLETPVKITPFFSISPFYRFYQQTAANYFAPYAEHKTTDQFYTSNYNYAAFSSNYEGVNLRLAPPNGVLHMKGFSALELRYGHYNQTTGLVANSVTVGLEFK